MFDLIVIGGDSNSYGAECVADGDNINQKNIDLAYGKYIQDELNITQYVNLAYPGLSNIKIFDKVSNYLNNLTVNYHKVLVVIGWSEPKRISMNIAGTEYNMSEFIINSIAADKWVNPDHKKMYESIKQMPFVDNFLKGVSSYIFTSEYFLYQDMLIRLSMDTFLKNKGVKYFTFPAMEEEKFSKYKSLRNTFTKNNLFTYNKGQVKDFTFETKFNMFDMFSKYGRSTINYHLKTEAHKELAKFIISEMKKRNIISSA